MKRAISLLVAFTFVLSMATPILAFELPRPIDKLTKGILTIVKTPKVLYDDTRSALSEAKHSPLNSISGLVQSPFHMIKHAGSGAIDVATFPVK